VRLIASLKSRLILYSLTIASIVLVTLIGTSFVTLRGFLRANLTESIRYRLRIAMEFMDRDMDRLTQLVSWSTVSEDVVGFVSSLPASESERRRRALAAYYFLRDAVFSNGLDAYVDKFIVAGAGGQSVQYGLVQGDFSDHDRAKAEFERLAASAPQGSTTMAPQPFKYSKGKTMIPLSMPIGSVVESGGTLGFSFMAVNTDLISRYLAGFEREEGTRLVISIGGRSYEVLGGRVSAEALEDPLPRGTVSFAGEKSGWTLSQTMPTLQFTKQNTVFAWLLALMAGSIVLLAFLLVLMADRTVNRPIRRINRRVGLISKGDFAHDPAIEWENELGDIGRAINGMSRDIEDLIDRRLSEEKARKDLEFRMLQSQINPHFLYNTLGAIKWMAEIQKAPGIAEVVNALAALLRHAAQGSETLITLERELELVGEYCLIQRYRSANLFKLRVLVADETLKRCLVVKFMLQPIVENAIIHGIEPKMEPGTVTIEARPEDGGRMRVSVTDDGIGIEPSRLSSALEEGPGDGKAFNHIGLRNVDERLKLAFGEKSGLSIESEAGSHTRVSMVLPRIESEA
jgi:two-component system sensor histidine kinase YesM